jgi:hypothetical protein
MKKYFDTYIGWFGLILLVANQAILAFGYSRSWYDATMFLIVNLTGSLAIAYVSWRKSAYEPMTLNIFAIAITIIGYIFQKTSL